MKSGSVSGDYKADFFLFLVAVGKWGAGVVIKKYNTALSDCAAIRLRCSQHQCKDKISLMVRQQPVFFSSVNALLRNSIVNSIVKENKQNRADLGFKTKPAIKCE